MIQPNRPLHDLSKIEDSILTYLVASPDALDTARGVCDTWLSEIEPRPSVGAVERALERLHRRGHLSRELRNGAAPLWSSAAKAQRTAP